MNVKEALEELGYKLRDDGGFYRAKAIYRDGGNPLSLRINKLNGSFVDFSSGESGSFQKLVSLTLRCPEADVPSSFAGRIEFIREEKESLKFIKKFKLDDIGTLVESYKYFLDRGVSKETLKLFGAKLALSGKMYRRIIFPIYDESKDIIGISGRAVDEDREPKWKHLGSKRNFLYPLFLNRDVIKRSRRIVLVEGISDIITLWDIGIQDTLCLFGTSMSAKLLNLILKINPTEIIISTNNEPDNFDIGLEAAKKIEAKLSVFFSPSVISIKLPFKKDFSAQSQEENLKWKAENYGSN